uniref:Uncharacterized protein n=1 Tax=Rhizophora mucronata TaxID=61149 RepID=A0A2P2PK26_RHIMU
MNLFESCLCLLGVSELNLDLKIIKQEYAKFWGQHPAIVKTELLIHAQLNHESAELSPALLGDFRRARTYTSPSQRANEDGSYTTQCSGT